MQILVAVYAAMFLLSLIIIRDHKTPRQGNFMKVLCILLVYITSVRILEESGWVTVGSAVYFSARISFFLFIPLSFLFVRECYLGETVQRKDLVHIVPSVSCVLYYVFFYLDRIDHSASFLFFYSLLVYTVIIVYLILLFMVLHSSFQPGFSIKSRVGTALGIAEPGNEQTIRSESPAHKREDALRCEDQDTDPLTDNDTMQIKLSIEHVMGNQEPYLKKKYTIGELAEQTGLHLHQLSAFINRHYKMHYNDFINMYRVEYCKRKIMLEEEWKYLTLEAIAEESGFGNRNTFTAAFKKFNGGSTPTEFLKQVKTNKSTAA
jgi:AraC-like DNA-binding protein